MWRVERWRNGWGWIIGIAGVAIGVLALSPGQWADRLSAWRLPIAILVGVLLGVALTVGTRRRREVGEADLVDSDRYAAIYRELIESGRYGVLKVFGYTGETVMADLVRFDDRYRVQLEFRFLHRNWLVEARDEERHNGRFDVTAGRPWSKAQAIRDFGLADWNFPCRRLVRYYDHQPTIKGVLFCPVGSEEPDRGLVSFQHWVDRPAEGGSQFKGTKQTAIYLCGEHHRSAAVLEYLNTQFEYEWTHGKVGSDLLAVERRRTKKS